MEPGVCAGNLGLRWKLGFAMEPAYGNWGMYSDKMYFSSLQRPPEVEVDGRRGKR